MSFSQRFHPAPCLGQIMVNITNPLVGNVGESVVIECSAFNDQGVFAPPGSIVLRNAISREIIEDGRIIPVVGESSQMKVYNLTNLRTSDNMMMIQCALEEFSSEVVILQVNCECYDLLWGVGLCW